MALESTLSLTQISAKDLPGGKGPVQAFSFMAVVNCLILKVKLSLCLIKYFAVTYGGRCRELHDFMKNTCGI